MSDVVLYKQIGRAQPQPIFSIAVDAPDRDIMIDTVKQQHMAEALASGSQTPVFTVTGLPDAPVAPVEPA